MVNSVEHRKEDFSIFVHLHKDRFGGFACSSQNIFCHYGMLFFTPSVALAIEIGMPNILFDSCAALKIT